MTTSDPTARLGTVAVSVGGQWTLGALLGEGGVGAVYRGRSEAGEIAAIKVLHAELRQEQAWIARLEREARLANMVEHPAVVRVLDAGELPDGTPFLVSEYVDGESLEDLRERHGGALPLEDVLAVADTLLEVLELAHRKRIVHRDIKPANLMRTESGEVRVLDFGLAREVGAAGNGLTNEGSIVGTVGFMAPEQAQGRWDLVDAGTDLWAVAATILKLATGLDVHEAETPQLQLALAATKAAAPIAARAPELPAFVAAALDRGLSFSKQGRFPNAAAFQRALRRRAGEPVVSVAPDAFQSLAFEPTLPGSFESVVLEAPTPHRPRMLTGTWVVAGSLAALLALGLVARSYVGASTRSPTPPVASAFLPVASAELPAASPPPPASGVEPAPMVDVRAPHPDKSAAPRASPPVTPRGTKRITPRDPPSASSSGGATSSPSPEAPGKDDILDRRR